MAKITLTQNTLVSPERFKQILKETMSFANPVDDLLELSSELHECERQYDMSSSDFYEAFQKGKLNDPLQHEIGWAAKYEMFLRLKRKVEASSFSIGKNLSSPQTREKQNHRSQSS